jgi:hypothetical protein
MAIEVKAAVVVPIGPGADSALDTLESVSHYCPEPHVIVAIDDLTSDGTYEALLSNRKPNWFVLRNAKRMGRERLVHTLAKGFKFVIQHFSCPLILRMDQDALLIKTGVITDAISYHTRNANIGLFGVYERDYDRPRSYEVHQKLIDAETRWYRNLFGLQPSWTKFLKQAEGRGYKRGDNVFGGAYFITRACLIAMGRVGALDIPFRWNSRLMEDVYYSMVTVACGFGLGHFAAPDGPLCLEWRGLPFPAHQLIESNFKLIHSVDRGKNTGPYTDNGTARQVFSALRSKERLKTGQFAFRG